jgi:UDP-N-acetylmuramoylalanine--D-glutamate ligase
MMDLAGKSVVVVGLGHSGIAAAELCRGRGARVVGTDALPLERLPEAVRLLDIDLVAGGHAGVDFSGADLIVVSPGVPAFAELDSAQSAGVPVIGELELACRFVTAPIIAVGGTNGKSTVTTLIADLLRAGGFEVFAGANLGTPAARAVGSAANVLVLEVSSFQLERAPLFHPKVSILLNVTEDHLDRYSSFAAYADAKGNAFANQTPDDFSLYPEGDAECWRQARRGAGRLVSFGIGADYATEGSDVVERATGERFALGGAALHGAHNHSNAAAAIAAVRVLGLHRDAVARGLSTFRPLGHRMALVAHIRGVTYYDDSKGTNVGAAVTALAGLREERAVLIAGGRDKLGSYEPLVRVLERKGRALVLLGEAAERIASAVGSRLPVERATSMDDAVVRASRLAQAGDAVLLSPACSSFDMFKSYSDRGEHFARAVAALEPASDRREAQG